MDGEVATAAGSSCKILNMREMSLGKLHIRQAELHPDNALVQGNNFSFPITSFHPNCKVAGMLSDKVTGATSFSGSLWCIVHEPVAKGAAVSCMILYIA